MPRHSLKTASRAQRRWRAVLSGLLLVGQLAPTLNASATSLSDTGQWTGRQKWPQVPVHMALLRGSASPYHSKVLWWMGLGAHERFFGGVWGWRVGEYTCSSYPDYNVLSPLAFEAPPATGSPFCSGHSQLADGKILLAGGTQPGTEFGIRKSYTFDASASTNIAWQAKDSMDFARWYPSLTTLADGKALVLSGSHHQHLHFFGGLVSGQTVPIDSAIFRYGIGEGGVSDAPVRTSSTPDWPDARDGHTATRADGFESERRVTLLP